MDVGSLKTKSARKKAQKLFYPPRRSFALTCAFAFLLISNPALATTVAGPQTITLDGKLTDTTGANPLLDPSVVINVKIYNPAGTCILYEESQTVSTSSTDGRFTILVGSAVGSGKRVAGVDPGNPMVTVFSNQQAIAGISCTYTPLVGDTRLMHLTLSPSSTGTIEQLTPDTLIDSVPFALMAESLQGLDRDHVLAIDSTTTLSQANLANVFSATNYPILTALLAGTNSQYVKSSSNGAVIPSVSGTPSSTTTGQIWFNSSANAFQYYNGSAVQTLGVAGSGISSLTVGSSITANGVTNTAVASGATLDLVNSGVNAGTYSKVTVNSKGVVTYGTGLSETDIPILSTPGRVSGSAITFGTIGGSTNFYSSGTVTTQMVSSGVDLTRQIQLFDPATGSAHKITISAPTLASDYSLVFPTTAGSFGYALTTDGSGNLSWSNVTSNTLPTLAAGKIWVGNSSNIATAVTPVGDMALSIAGSATVTGLQGSPLSAIPPTVSGQILRWNGSAWTPNSLAMSDLRSTITGTSALTSCTSAQTLVFNSVTDSLLCSNILVANSQINWGSTGANLVFAGPSSGGAAGPTFRTLTSADLPAGIASQWQTVSATIHYLAGAVGIGTATPQATLDVYGTGISSAILIPRDSTAARPAGVNGMIRYNTSTNSVETFANNMWATIASSASGASQWTTSGSNIFYNSTGNVGIGSANPGTTLDVAGSINASNSLNSYTANIGLFTVGPYNSAISYNGNNVFYINGNPTGSNNYVLEVEGGAPTTSAFLVKYKNNGGFVSTIDLAGNMYVSNSIGIGTTAPQAILDIYGLGTAQSAILVPRDSTQNRPAGINGMLRYNTTNAQLETYSSGAWAGLSTGSSASGSYLPLSGGTMSGAISHFNGTAALPGIAFADTTTGFYSTGAGNVTLSTAGTARVTVSPSGNVGIGTATPNATLDINGNIRAFSITFPGAGTISSSGNNIVSTLTAGGNLGVGTASPQALLDVYGTGTASAILVPRDSTANRPTAPVNGMIRYATDLARLETYSSGAWNGLATSAAGGGASQWITSGSNIYFNSSGNVGVGTAAPGAQLTVGSPAQGSAASAVFQANSGTLGTTLNSDLNLGSFGFSSANQESLGVHAYRASNGNSWSSTSLMLGMDVDSSIRAGGWISLSSNGNIGIGSATPVAKLDVNGAIAGHSRIGPETSLAGAILPVQGFYIAWNENSGQGMTDFMNHPGNGGGGFDFSLYGSAGSFLSTPFVITGAGFLGVGTTAPQALLDVYGSGTSSAMIVPRDSTTNRPTGINGMLRYNTTNSQLETYSSGAWAGLATSSSGSGGSSQWTTSGSNLYYGSGNVGIGTSAPPGQLSLYQSAADPGLSMQNGSNSRFWLATVGGTFFVGASGATQPTSGGIAVTNGGSIGIGSTSPGAVVDVVGGNYQTGIRITSSSTQGAGVSVKSTDSGGHEYDFYATGSGNSGGAGSFKIYDATAAANRFTITSAGNFGLLTPTPQSTLDVSGGMAVGSYAGVSAAPANGLIVSGNFGVGTTLPQAILDVNGSGTSQSAMIVPRDSTTNRPTGINGMLRYNTTNAQLEGFANGIWTNLGSSSGSGLSQWTNISGGISYSSGNVAIGTTSTSSLLDVYQNSASDLTVKLENVYSGKATNVLTYANSLYATNEFQGQPGADWKIGLFASTNFVFYDPNNNLYPLQIEKGAATNSLYLKNSGSVGIGVNAPLSKLDVNGGIAVGSYAAVNAAPTNGLIVSGNVGIGTTSPNALLEVNGALKVDGAINSTVSSSGANINGSLLQIGNNGTGDAIASWIAGGTRWYAGLDQSDSNKWKLASTVGTPSFASDTRLTVTQNGTVGIGTPNPNTNQAMNIYRSGNVDEFLSTGSTSLHLRSDSSNSYISNMNNFVGDGSSGNGQLILTGQSGIVLAYGSAGSAGTTAMTLSNAGNVGVGTSAPNAKFHLYGGDLRVERNANADGAINFAGGANYIYGNNSSNYLEIGTNSLMRVHVDGSGNVGVGTATPSYTLHVVGNAGLSSGTAWTNASDLRLKDIHGDYEYGLNQILKLHTVRYSYKKDNALNIPSDHPMTGIIAQEVQKVIPDAINTRKDGFLELNIDPIHWAVVNAIKDLYKKWFDDSEALHDQVDKLKKENAELKAYLCSKDPSATFCGY